VIRDSERLRTVTKMSEIQARTSWENKYCELTDTPNTIKCKFCPNIFPKLQRVYFTKHLYKVHRISELTEHPNREFLENKFTINFDSENGKCKTCEAVISYENRGMYLLENHYEMIHDNANLFRTVLKIVNGEEMLNNFILLKSVKAVCTSCELKINIENLDVLPAETLTKLAVHFFSHDRYVDNFLIFNKTTKNRFCLTCFFFSIIS